MDRMIDTMTVFVDFGPGQTAQSTDDLNELLKDFEITRCLGASHRPEGGPIRLTFQVSRKDKL